MMYSIVFFGLNIEFYENASFSTIKRNLIKAFFRNDHRSDDKWVLSENSFHISTRCFLARINKIPHSKVL